MDHKSRMEWYELDLFGSGYGQVAGCQIRDRLVCITNFMMNEKHDIVFVMRMVRMGPLINMRRGVTWNTMAGIATCARDYSFTYMLLRS
jgi:hypothetical protein